MQTHNLKGSRNKKKKRVGRGGKRGTYSGRGMKGQKARAGRKIRPQARDVIKKIHKKRGYFFRSIQTKPQIVNLDDLEKKFGNEDKITTEGLFAAGLIKKRSGKMTKVKILGRGKLTKKLEFSKNLLMSESVKTAAARLKK